MQKPLSLPGCVIRASLCIAAILSAHEGEPSRMTLERLFQPGSFDVRAFGPARWLNEGNGYTTLEDSPGETGGRNIVFYRTEKEDRRVLVSAGDFVSEGRNEPLITTLGATLRIVAL